MVRSACGAVVGAVVCGGVAAPAFAQVKGTVTHFDLTGPATGAPMVFNIYLPPGYAEGTTRYPVVYHLHGIGGNENGQQTTIVPQVYEIGADLGVVRPVIVVFPSGFGDAFWADAIGGDKPAESMVMQDLIPYIDAHFRTIAHPKFRVIQGYSMGGFGAVKFFSKFPEAWACCVAFDGAIMFWEQVEIRHPEQAASIFGNSGEYFDEYSPWTWPVANAGVIGPATRVRMAEGLLVDYGRLYRDHLNAQGIGVDYVETGCPHNLACVLQAEGLASVAFVESNLGVACAQDINGDGFTNSSDFNVLAGHFGEAVPPSTNGDLNSDGVVDSADFNILAGGYGCAP